MMANGELEELAKATKDEGGEMRLAPGVEIGNTGLKVNGGWIDEEPLRELSGAKGVETYSRMANDDATVGAFLRAIELLIVQVAWSTEPADDSEEAKDLAEFVDSLRDDMSGTWTDFVSEVLTMLVYGWSLFEIVYKRRMGPTQKDSTRRSKHDDGRIGWRKLAPRPQETLHSWDLEPDGGILAMRQNGTASTQVAAVIPMEKALLFRTVTRKNNPEGRSILRTAYRAWFRLTRTEEVEAIGIERELAGVPVVEVPNQVLAGRDSESVAARTGYEKIARDLRFNQQGAIMIPSDTYTDKDGKASAIRKVNVRLMTSGGTRAMDPRKVVEGYKADIARSVLADFLLLGTSGKTGTFNLSESKTDLFLLAAQRFLVEIADVVNRHGVARIWALNGLPMELMPKMKPGRISPVNLAALGDYLQKLAGAGMPLFPDDRLAEHLREVADLPEQPEDGIPMPDMMGDNGGPPLDDEEGRVFDPQEGQRSPRRAANDDTALALAKGIEPRPLYVHRKLLNGADFLRWARKAGFGETLSPGDLHVTVLYSRQPVDWMKMGSSWTERLEVGAGGPRILERFGDAIVLVFTSSDLSYRHDDMVASGASHDFPDYHSHVTITYKGGDIDLDAITPYQGPLVFGPELFEPINEDWAKGKK